MSSPRRSVVSGLSVVVPLHNEEFMVQEQVPFMVDALTRTGLDYEIFLCENGSVDGTIDAILQFSQENRKISVVQLPYPNYGLALRRGMESASFDVIVCLEIDHWSEAFIKCACDTLTYCDAVVASKRMMGAHDLRQWQRRLGTMLYHEVVKRILGYPGTDTHGMKAFNKTSIIPLLEACATTGDTLATEILVRAYYAGMTIAEVPCQTVEKRPARIPVWKRTWGLVRNMARLVPSVFRMRSCVSPFARGRVISLYDVPQV